MSHTYNYDPEKAKQLLAEAGVDPTSWGEIVFDTYYGDPGSLAAMTAIQANLADVGDHGRGPADGQRLLDRALLRRTASRQYVHDRWRRRRAERPATAGNSPFANA